MKPVNPQIYALSTVGILKHYNQDYLIHPERTDFTGANGVGKSIIADLFQLIFINDKQLFQFGTEGYKKEERQINKLPYKCKDAYTFLVIEIKPGKFICIGVCIPNNSNRPLKPFIITSDPDTEKPLIDRAFTHEQIPKASHFINIKQQICTVEDLAKHFRDTYGLYFEYYSTREHKDEHYARLYDQYLLPVNLSNPSSLKAFAKIIQSFSRARSSGEKSQELKDFLFDGVERELEQSFDEHKIEIEKLLRDYDDMQKFISDLEKKQTQLETLHGLDTAQCFARKAYLMGKAGNALAVANKAKIDLDQKIKTYDQQVQLAGQYAKQIPRFKLIAAQYQSLQTQSETKLKTIESCQQLSGKIAVLNKRISDLTLDDLPAIIETYSGVDLIENYEDKEIIRRCDALRPVYQTYGSIKAIQEQIEQQKIALQTRKTELNNEIAHFQLLKQLFTGTDENFLIAQVLKSDKAISPAQEAVLFHLLKTHWQKPNTSELPYYASSFDFFDPRYIITDEALKGYWLNLNDLHIFIPALKREPVLGDPSLRKGVIAEMLKKNELAITAAQAELQQLTFFEKHQPYDIGIAPMLKDLDGRLYDYAVASQFAITAQLILQLDGKTESLQREVDQLQQQLNQELRLAGIPATLDLSLAHEQETQNTNTWKIKAADWQQRIAEDQAAEKALNTTTIPTLAQQTEDLKALASRTMTIYLADRLNLEGEFPELLTETMEECSDEQLRALKDSDDKATINFQSAFRAACQLFTETSKANNPEIHTELAANRFSFALLERALLGVKVRFHDQIGEELRTANRARQKLVDSIHETMLKIFIRTKSKYEEYRAQVRELNLFFGARTISNKYFFQVDFIPSKTIPIEWINQLQSQAQFSYQPGEIQFGDTVETFVEDFFKKACGYRSKIAFRELLDPKTYFTLDAGLSDANGKAIAGSTGETYSAKVLLGIGRLSKVQSQNRLGIRFIILEETANLDKTNFNNFPVIAEQFGYQIITMTPKPFGGDATAGWYLHHLLPGQHDPDINYPVPASYFKTNTGRERLLDYLQRQAQ